MQPLLVNRSRLLNSTRFDHRHHRCERRRARHLQLRFRSLSRTRSGGEPDKLTGSRFRYTGQILIAELGLYHYKARTYSPWLGRFLQTDPIGYGDGPNPYAYTHNDPINATDPWGLRTICYQVDDSHYEDRVWVITWTERCTEFPNEWFSPSLYFGSVDHVVEASPEPKTPPQRDTQPQMCQIAWTPDGDTKDDNPKAGSGGYKTDIPGSTLLDAGAVYTGLRRLAGDTSMQSFPYGPLRPDILSRSYPSGIQLRLGTDLRYRIDIPAGVFDLSKPETIHFKGGKGNMCPTN